MDRGRLLFCLQLPVMHSKEIGLLEVTLGDADEICGVRAFKRSFVSTMHSKILRCKYKYFCFCLGEIPVFEVILGCVGKIFDVCLCLGMSWCWFLRVGQNSVHIMHHATCYFVRLQSISIQLYMIQRFARGRCYVLFNYVYVWNKILQRICFISNEVLLSPSKYIYIYTFQNIFFRNIFLPKHCFLLTCLALIFCSWAAAASQKALLAEHWTPGAGMPEGWEGGRSHTFFFFFGWVLLFWWFFICTLS